MKSIFWVVSMVIALVACSGEEATALDDEQGVVINIQQRQERNGLAYQVNSEKPFTGKVVESYSNGQKLKEIGYTNGKLDGLLITWHKNGQKKSETLFKDGDGVKSFEWHENGQKSFEGEYEKGVMKHMLTWDENGNLEKEMNL